MALSGLAAPAWANDRGLEANGANGANGVNGVNGAGWADAATTTVAGVRPATFTITPATWSATSSPAAATGAVSAQPVSFSTSSSSFGAKVVYLASKQAGKPYVWGAEGPRAFDCSGLVRYVYKQLGRSIPRVSNAQYGASQKIPKSAKQPGDLIFFGRPGSIHHVGIYAGNGMMWAAPHSGAVVRLQKVYTNNYLVGRIR